MIKKIKIICSIMLVVFININIVFGGCNECKIKDGPAKSLDNYISDLRKIITNISSKTASYNSILTDKEKNPSLKKDLSSTKNKIIGIFNKIIDWESYFIDINFYIFYGTVNDYVYEIWRDYNLIDNESKGLDKYLKYIVEKGYNFDLTKDEICKGITSKCDFEGNNLEIIGKIITNNENIKKYYKLSIMGKTAGFNTNGLMLIGDDFATDFNTYYNGNTTSNCSSCDGGGFKRISDEIDKITNWQKNAQNGIKTWKEALALLNGTQEEQNALQRKLLEKELQRQGVSLKSSQAILNNFDRYNNTGGFSLDNNFITNSFNYIKDSAVKQFNEFKDTIGTYFKPKNTNSINALNLQKTYNDKIKSNEIEKIIDELYNQELPYAQIIDNSNQSLQGKIIEMHTNISQGIDSLNKTCEISKKVCNSQANGQGNCMVNCK